MVQLLRMTKVNKYTYLLTNILLLGIYLNTFGKNEVCTKLVIAALFIRVKNWKPPKCPSKKDHLTKSWCIKAMEYYAALK